MDQRLESLVNLGGVHAATLSEVRLAAATAAEDLGCASNEISRLDTLLACGFIGGHGNHGLAFLIHARKGHHDRIFLTELATDVKYGLAQCVEGTEMFDVLRSHLDRSLRSLGLRNQNRNGS